jgi:glycerate kinase
VRILVAPDKFKGSLGAAEAAQAIGAGLRDVLRDAQVTCLPIADGGEGTADVICSAVGGEWHSCTVHDPLGRLVRARYCTIGDGATAVMEMSEASGLWRLAPHERDPLRASTFGTGEMLLDAARRGVREIIIGLGGSATNDGGFGMARALGFRFLDRDGADTSDLLKVDRMTTPNDLLLPRITTAVDVRSPLLGEGGATAVFGPQKGATAEQIDLLEHALTRLAEIVGGDAKNIPGAGAAGGLGFGLVSFCGATVHSGFEVVSGRIGLSEAVQLSDVVITGEGRLDAQTIDGKGPAGVAELARKFRKPVYAIVGVAEADERVASLFDDVFSLTTSATTNDEAMRAAARLLRERAAELATRCFR